VSSPFPEGSLVTLNCETNLLLQRPGLQLHFSFYVGSKILEYRNTSSEYHIARAEREDAGFYWCEVATEDSSVLKRSPELELQVLGEYKGSVLPTPRLTQGFVVQPGRGTLYASFRTAVTLQPSLNFFSLLLPPCLSRFPFFIPFLYLIFPPDGFLHFVLHPSL
jgi:hypothetical protein